VCATFRTIFSVKIILQRPRESAFVPTGTEKNQKIF